MIFFAQKMARLETDADKVEFVRGMSNLNDPKKAKKAVLTGLVAGYLLSNRLKKK